MEINNKKTDTYLPGLIDKRKVKPSAALLAVSLFNKQPIDHKSPHQLISYNPVLSQLHYKIVNSSQHEGNSRVSTKFSLKRSDDNSIIYQTTSKVVDKNKTEISNENISTPSIDQIGDVFAKNPEPVSMFLSKFLGVHQLDLFRIKYLSHFFGKLEKTQAVDFQEFQATAKSSITYQAFFNNLSRAVVGVALPDTIYKNVQEQTGSEAAAVSSGLFCAMTNAMILETTLTAKALDSSDSATIIKKGFPRLAAHYALREAGFFAALWFPTEGMPYYQALPIKLALAASTTLPDIAVKQTVKELIPKHESVVKEGTSTNSNFRGFSALASEVLFPYKTMYQKLGLLRMVFNSAASTRAVTIVAGVESYKFIKEQVPDAIASLGRDALEP